MTGSITSHVYTMPDGVRAAPEGRALSEMLIAGELDAIYSPPRPRRYHPVDGPIVRLFPGYPVDREGIFPRHRCLSAAASRGLAARRVGGEQVDRARPDRCLRAAAPTLFGRAQRSFPYASPWQDAELEETEALMGADFHADGFERNRAVVELFAEQALAAGIVTRRISADEYFAEYLEG